MKPVILFTILIIIAACKQDRKMLQNGDLLFVSKGKSTLSNAINDVTQTDKGTDYSHVALVERKDGSIYVLHASTENGSERISLDTFLARYKEQQTITVYRLKRTVDFNKVIQRAGYMLGKPYNYTYILTDTAYYCSDYIYNAFVSDSVFRMEPMTFINPKTGKTDAAWMQYYRERNLPVPEGLPGCNPNGMAASEKLERLGILNENRQIAP